MLWLSYKTLTLYIFHYSHLFGQVELRAGDTICYGTNDVQMILNRAILHVSPMTQHLHQVVYGDLMFYFKLEIRQTFHKLALHFCKRSQNISFAPLVAGPSIGPKPWVPVC